MSNTATGVGCNRCAACADGQFNRCPELKVIGGHRPGGFAQFAVIPADRAFKISEELTAEAASLIEPASVAVHAVNRLGDIVGKDVLVMGAGPIGLLALQVLQAAGAGRVAVSDPVDNRLQLALELGADFVFNPLDGDLVSAVRAAMNAAGIDAAIDCAGKESTLQQALHLTRTGGVIALAAIYDKDPVIPIRQLQRGERELVGVQMYVREDFATAAQLIRDGRISTLKLVTHTFPLKQIGEAFRVAMDRTQTVGKVVVRIEED